MKMVFLNSQKSQQAVRFILAISMLHLNFQRAYGFQLNTANDGGLRKNPRVQRETYGTVLDGASTHHEGSEKGVATLEREDEMQWDLLRPPVYRNTKPSGSMRFIITKSSDLLGITFKTEDGVIKVDDIDVDAVESVAKNFQVGDIVLAMNEMKYSNNEDLATPIRGMEIGDTMIFDILRLPQTHSEEPLEEALDALIAEVKNEIAIEESMSETSFESDIKTQSEEPLSEPFIAEIKNEIIIEENVPEAPAKSDIKEEASKMPAALNIELPEKEEASAKPVADATGEKEPEITVVLPVKPSGPMKFAIIKSSDLLGINFKSYKGVIRVDQIDVNAVEGVAKNFQVGDIVLAMEELRYSSDVELATSIRKIEIGELMTFDIFRVPQVNIGIQKSFDALGMAFQKIDGKITVAKISDDAPWEVLDQFKLGDQIDSVNGVSYDTDERMANAIKEMEVGETINFLIQREDSEVKYALESFAFARAQIEKEDGEPTEASVDYENTITTSSGKAYSFLNVEVPKTDKALGLAFIMASGNIEVAKIQNGAPLEVTDQLQVGDEILSMNGVAYATDDDMAAAIRGLDVGALINFEVRRLLKVPQGFTGMNIRVEKPSESLGLAFKMFQGSITLASFEEGVPSEMVDQLKVGDRIVSVNGVSFSTADEMIAAVKKLEVGATINFEVQRSTTVYQGTVPFVPKEVVAAAALKAAEEMASTDDTNQPLEQEMMMNPEVMTAEVITPEMMTPDEQSFPFIGEENGETTSNSLDNDETTSNNLDMENGKNGQKKEDSHTDAVLSNDMQSNDINDFISTLSDIFGPSSTKNTEEKEDQKKVPEYNTADPKWMKMINEQILESIITTYEENKDRWSRADMVEHLKETMQETSDAQKEQKDSDPSLDLAEDPIFNLKEEKIECPVMAFEVERSEERVMIVFKTPNGSFRIDYLEDSGMILAHSTSEDEDDINPHEKTVTVDDVTYSMNGEETAFAVEAMDVGKKISVGMKQMIEPSKIPELQRLGMLQQARKIQRERDELYEQLQQEQEQKASLQKALMLQQQEHAQKLEELKKAVVPQAQNTEAPRFVLKIFFSILGKMLKVLKLSNFFRHFKKTLSAQS